MVYKFVVSLTNDMIDVLTEKKAGSKEDSEEVIELKRQRKIYQDHDRTLAAMASAMASRGGKKSRKRLRKKRKVTKKKRKVTKKKRRRSRKTKKKQKKSRPKKRAYTRKR
jgi:hypothetical protein